MSKNQVATALWTNPTGRKLQENHIFQEKNHVPHLPYDPARPYLQFFFAVSSKVRNNIQVSTIQAHGHVRYTAPQGRIAGIPLGWIIHVEWEEVVEKFHLKMIEPPFW